MSWNRIKYIKRVQMPCGARSELWEVIVGDPGSLHGGDSRIRNGLQMNAQNILGSAPDKEMQN